MQEDEEEGTAPSADDSGAYPRATEDPLVGRVLLGRYRVVRRLARGGMGVVYLARTEGAAGFVKPVVIKRIIPNEDETELIGMFVREARILSHLRHPNIAGIVDFAEEEGAHLMVLEYVHGFDVLQWRRYIRKQNEAFDVEIALHICISILDALSHAHRIEHPDGSVVTIVHRDISLSNVLIDTEAHVKLIDFGIARIQGGETGLYKTTTAMVKGKIPFLAPELLSGTAPTPATDVYSCAVLLHDLILGRNELKGTRLPETVRLVIGHNPSPPSADRDDVPKALDAILARALSKNPSVRYQTADELAKALRTVATISPHEARARLLAQIRDDYAAMPAALALEPLEDRERSLRTPVQALKADPEDEGITDIDAKTTTRAPRRVSRAAWVLYGIILLVVVAASIALALFSLEGQRRAEPVLESQLDRRDV